MYIGVISMRYAKALLAYADEKGCLFTLFAGFNVCLLLFILHNHTVAAFVADAWGCVSEI